MKPQAGIKAISGWKSCLLAFAADKRVRINHIGVCGLSCVFFHLRYFVLLLFFLAAASLAKIDDFLKGCAFQR
jgi:hypothetical protein